MWIAVSTAWRKFFCYWMCITPHQTRYKKRSWWKEWDNSPRSTAHDQAENSFHVDEVAKEIAVKAETARRYLVRLNLPDDAGICTALEDYNEPECTKIKQPFFIHTSEWRAINRKIGLQIRQIHEVVATSTWNHLKRTSLFGWHAVELSFFITLFELWHTDCAWSLFRLFFA